MYPLNIEIPDTMPEEEANRMEVMNLLRDINSRSGHIVELLRQRELLSNAPH